MNSPEFIRFCDFLDSIPSKYATPTKVPYSQSYYGECLIGKTGLEVQDLLMIWSVLDTALDRIGSAVKEYPPDADGNVYSEITEFTVMVKPTFDPNTFDKEAAYSNWIQMWNEQWEYDCK